MSMPEDVKQKLRQTQAEKNRFRLCHQPLHFLGIAVDWWEEGGRAPVGFGRIRFRMGRDRPTDDWKTWNFAVWDWAENLDGNKAARRSGPLDFVRLKWTTGEQKGYLAERLGCHLWVTEHVQARGRWVPQHYRVFPAEPVLAVFHFLNLDPRKYLVGYTRQYADHHQATVE